MGGLAEGRVPVDESEGFREDYGVEAGRIWAGLHCLLKDVNLFRSVSDSPIFIMSKGSPAFYMPSGISVSEYIERSRAPVLFAALRSSAFSCPRCVIELYRHWEQKDQRSVTMKDHIGDGERLQRTRKKFSSSHNRWRKKFLKNSGTCVSCGAAEELELAHITPVEEFFYSYRKGRRLRHPSAKYLGVELSYREDNLRILCRRCHDAQTMNWGLYFAVEKPGEFVEMIHRKHTVMDIFESVIKKRGWRSAEDLQQTKLF